eukprot:2661912-Amphidinium_carterae.1
MSKICLSMPRSLDQLWGVILQETTRARVCVQDFKSQEVRYDTYSPTPYAGSLRLLLVVALLFKLSVGYGDFTSAFLHVEMPPNTEVWIKPPRVLNRPTEERWRLKHALYGWRLAPRLFYEHLCRVLEGLGFKASVADPAVFMYIKPTSHPLLVLAHVDDPMA